MVCEKFLLLHYKSGENICYYFPWSITHGASLPIYEWTLIRGTHTTGMYSVTYIHTRFRDKTKIIRALF